MAKATAISMAVMTFDLGWHFGWCTWRRGDVIESGVVDLTKESRDDGIRLLAKSQWMTAKRAEIHAAGETLEDMAYEEINFVGDENGIRAMHCHGMQLGVVKRFCALHRIDCIGIPWNTVKKHATGHGSASQSTVLECIRRLFPEVTDHNQASAVAVMLTAKNKYPHTQGSPHAAATSQAKARAPHRR